MTLPSRKSAPSTPTKREDRRRLDLERTQRLDSIRPPSTELQPRSTVSETFPPPSLSQSQTGTSRSQFCRWRLRGIRCTRRVCPTGARRLVPHGIRHTRPGRLGREVVRPQEVDVAGPVDVEARVQEVRDTPQTTTVGPTTVSRPTDGQETSVTPV